MFDVMIEADQNVFIRSAGKVINKDGGNWQDWNKGSMMMPVQASQCCEC
jgi:hypothetical protein